MLTGRELMTMVGSAGAGEVTVRQECVADVVRIVIGGMLTEAASAVAREILADACEQGTEDVVLALEASIDLETPDLLRHLVDVAQQYCWSASCWLEVTATEPDVCEVLASAGIWPSAQPEIPTTVLGEEPAGRASEAK